MLNAPRRPVNSKSLAGGLALSAFVLFGSTSLVVKPSHLEAYDLVFLRFLITAVISGLLSLFWIKEFRQLTPKVVFAILGTSACIFLNMICLFASFRRIPISVAIALFYTGPMFTLLFRRVLDKTPISRKNGIACLLSFLAISLLANQAFLGGAATKATTIGYGLATLGGVLFGLIPIVEARAGKVSPVISLFIQSLFAVACLAPFCLSGLTKVGYGDIAPLFVLSIGFTLCPFLLWWQAIRVNPNLSPFFSYADPVTACLIGFLVFAEPVSTVQTIAIFLLAVAILFPQVQFRKPLMEGVRSI